MAPRLNVLSASGWNRKVLRPRTCGCTRENPPDLVEQLAVVGGDVLDVGHVLVAAFDLEAAQCRFSQGAQVGALVVVLHGQQMLVCWQPGAVPCRRQDRRADGRPGNIRPVGAAAGVGVADVALATEGHAQRAVDEELQRAQSVAAAGGLGSR